MNNPQLESENNNNQVMVVMGLLAGVVALIIFAVYCHESKEQVKFDKAVTQPLVEALIKKNLCIVDNEVEAIHHPSAITFKLYAGRPYVKKNPQHVLDKSKAPYIYYCDGHLETFIVPHGESVDYNYIAEQIDQKFTTDVTWDWHHEQTLYTQKQAEALFHKIKDSLTAAKADTETYF